MSQSTVLILYPQSAATSRLVNYDAYIRMLEACLQRMRPPTHFVTAPVRRQPVERIFQGQTAEIVVFVSGSDLEEAQAFKARHPEVRVVLFTSNSAGLTPNEIVLTPKGGGVEALRRAILGY